MKMHTDNFVIIWVHGTYKQDKTKQKKGQIINVLGFIGLDAL